ncbi:reticulocalbin-2 [Anthonomus grandis grandis]|uniref:reticulocalbin-2 n=1 Tax=Anthonomus grandis grandis TaxID=2921223 RepID=UPI002166C0C5|nr:reticulocalbin-2 [Anthonomus grandis grandis]
MVTFHKLCLNFCVFLICQCLCSAAVVSNKLHGAHEHLTKEREKDGPYSPQDQHVHYDDSGAHQNHFDHEAILGSSKEAEEYDTLPPEEAKKRLAILLKKMDTSHDGYIDRTELQAWILKSFMTLAEEEVQERMEDMDENGDGLVSWEEFIADTYGVLENTQNLQFNDDNYHLIKEDREMWEAADKNGNDILDEDEFKRFHSPEDYPEMRNIIINQTLKNKDTDKDGSISFQEFIGDKGALMDKENLLIEQNKFDHDFDRDNDGKLTGDEILYWIVPSNEDIANEEVTHLFASSDDDHDDLLSFEEVIEHHDIFVGSEATDYGDHLHNIHHLDDEL